MGNLPLDRVFPYLETAEVTIEPEAISQIYLPIGIASKLLEKYKCAIYLRLLSRNSQSLKKMLKNFRGFAIEYQFNDICTLSSTVINLDLSQTKLLTNQSLI